MQKCTNRFLYRCEMKRILSCILCLIFLFSLSSCGDVADTFQKEKLVAVEYASANENACEDYVNQGYTKVTYNSSSDVVLAVENKKTDFGILDEIELSSYLMAERDIKQIELCKYNIDYCAYFSSDNQKLQNLFDEAIKELKENGTIDEIKEAHLNEKRFLSNKINSENGTLTMLCDPSFKKRVYTDDNGEIFGLDVDIAREICNCLGYDLEIVTADFDELFLKLENGEGDFIISACEVVEERSEYYLLSDTYFTLNYYLIEKE